MVSLSKLPLAIAAFIRAAEQRDKLALLATFAEGATLVDRGTEHYGAVREWSDDFLSADRLKIYPINSARRDGKIVLSVIVQHNAVTEGVVTAQCDWSFLLQDGKIAALTIAPSPSPVLPAPVAHFVSAMNSFNLEEVVSTFADDAVVNDQLQEYWSKSAIRRWAERDIVRNHVRMFVIDSVERYGDVIIKANVDGDYDKRGLPDPLVLDFYFTIRNERISQLIILRNEVEL